jgi:hypothetical protein
MPALAVMAGSASEVRAQAAISAPQTAAPATVPAPAAAPVDGDHIPVKTVVEIEITEAISSKTGNVGDGFALKLVAPLVIGGKTVLPAGLAGRGEVTHVGKTGSGGQSGELIVNARFLQCGDLRIPLGHFHHAATGKGNMGAAFAMGALLPFGQLLVSGHDVTIPAGTGGTAQVNEDVSLAAVKQCAPAAG